MLEPTAAAMSESAAFWEEASQILKAHPKPNVQSEKALTDKLFTFLTEHITKTT